MSQTVKIFLTKDSYGELIHQFKDKEDELKKTMFRFVLPIAKIAKITKLNRQLQLNVPDGNKQKVDTMDFKDIDWDEIPVEPNAKWSPEDFKPEELQAYQLSITDRMWKEVCFFAKMHYVRQMEFNKRLDTSEKDYEERKKEMPTCVEQVLQEAVINPIMQKIQDNIDADFTKEWEEMNVNKPKGKGKEKKKN